MPSAPQPDALPADEVVEVFTGDTLEEAMAYAVASLGPDLVVRRARKVRKGVPGLVGKDRYEVLATPCAPPPSTDAVGSAFDALLSQAEASEDPTPVRRTTRPASPVEALTPVPAARVALPRAVAEPVAAPMVAPEPLVAPVVVTEAVAADPVVAPPVEQACPVVVAAPVAKAVLPATKAKAPAASPAATAAKTARPRKAPAKRAKASGTGWSRARLEALGLPSAVLAGLPEQDPTSDLAWAAHLAEAIEAVLPQAAVLSAANPLVVDGYGIEGVIGLLDAATRGLTPGTITVGDRTVPATASELALVVRTAVLSC